MEEIINECRNAFVISDDTSQCEKLCRACDEFFVQMSKVNGSSFNHKYSPEMKFVPDQNFYRWNQLSKQRKPAQSTSPSSYQSYQSENLPESIPELVIEMRIPHPLPADPSRKSALTIALEKAQMNGKSVNKFSDFAVFDGRLADGKSNRFTQSSSVTLRPFKVCFWSVSGLPKISISAQPTETCAVRDFVGLALWQYFNENPSAISAFNTKPSHLDKDGKSIVEQIKVYMMDTPDEVEDLPPFEPTDLIYKYDFDGFALKENAAIVDTTEPSIVFTVHLAQGISRVHLPPSATLECVVNDVLNRRMLRQHEGYAYRLEEWIDPEDKPTLEEAEAARKPLDLSMTIAEYTRNCSRTHFALIREHSRYDPVGWDADRWPHGDESSAANTSSDTIAARNLQSRKYRATQIRGASTRDVQITVSRDKLDIQASKIPKIFRGGSKSLTIPMPYVLDCVICSSNDLSVMPFNKVPFVISYLKHPTNDKSGCDGVHQIYSSEGNKSTCGGGDIRADKLVDNFTLDDVVGLEFEAQWSSARAIFNQIKVILSRCPSRLRDEYLSLRLAPATSQPR